MIEAAVILPLIFMILIGTIHVMFYYHDKILVNACGHDILTEAVRDDCMPAELEERIKRELKGQMLLFSNMQVNASVEQAKVRLECSATKHLLELQIRMQMTKTAPEQKLRALRILEKTGGSR